MSKRFNKRKYPGDESRNCSYWFWGTKLHRFLRREKLEKFKRDKDDHKDGSSFYSFQFSGKWHIRYFLDMPNHAARKTRGGRHAGGGRGGRLNNPQCSQYHHQHRLQTLSYTSQTQWWISQTCPCPKTAFKLPPKVCLLHLPTVLISSKLKLTCSNSIGICPGMFGISKALTTSTSTRCHSLTYFQAQVHLFPNQQQHLP